MTHLYLVRHGETSYNAERRIQGSSDIPLNAKGIQQAEQAAEKLTNLGIEVLLSSLLTRARQTAEIIGNKLNLETILMPQFVERRMGIFEGVTYSEINEKQPEMWDRFMHQYFAAPPSGESLFEVSLRVKDGLDIIRETYPNKTVLLVAHGYVGRVINGIIKRVQDEEFYDFLLSNGEIAEYEIE
ncbi:MAG: histidine phosphatase family protein [Anaerolineales bacterium]|nr:histidine phosphatase family protein [Anaerolineales bacterium]